MNRMRELREERKLTTRDMEKIIDVTHSAISLYELEKREPSVGVAKKMATYFEVSIDYLLCHSSYCVYALYKEGNFYFGIRADYYNELKEKKYIYFDNNNHRCIDINSLIGVGSTNNILELIQEFVRIEKMDALFDKKKVTDADIKALDDEITEIELTRGLVERIKDAIR